MAQRPAAAQPRGLTNYAALIHDALFLTAIRNTFIFALPAVGLEVMLGLALALALAPCATARTPT